MTDKKDEALKLALEALNRGETKLRYEAITAIREALAEPAQQQEPEFFTHSVDQPYDWSEWVCPDPKSYLMKCCDCGLVHEAEFGVVRYKSETEREDCDMVDDPNLQAVFRMRRSEQWSPVDTAHRAGGLPMAEQPAQQQVVEHQPCKGMNCGITRTDQEHSLECQAEHAAAIAGGAFVKPAQQEPVVWMYVNKSTHETKFQKHMRDFVDHSLWSEVPLYGEPLANHELQCVCGAVWLGDELVHLPDKRPPAQRKPLTDDPLQGAVDWLLEADGEYFCTATVQRTLRIGYNRAKRLCDTAKERAAHGIKGDA